MRGPLVAENSPRMLTPNRKASCRAMHQVIGATSQRLHRCTSLKSFQVAADASVTKCHRHVNATPQSRGSRGPEAQL